MTSGDRRGERTRRNGWCGAAAPLVAVVLFGCSSAGLSDVSAPRRPPKDAPPICPLGGCDTGAEPAQAAMAMACGGDSACAATAKAACDDAQPHACTQRAFQLWGQGITSALPLVVALFARACTGAAKSDAEACLYGGRMVLDGKGVARDTATGETMLARACDADRAQACVVLAAHFASPEAAPTQLRYEQTVTCLRGVGEACTVLAQRFVNGLGVPADAARAAHYYDWGCREAQPSACTSLGLAYTRGDGVTRDPVRAASLFDVACRGADAAGCAALGASTEYADAGGSPDLARAEALYAEACSLGLAYACIHDDMVGQYRSGVPHDPARAAPRWKADCDRTQGAACAFLGVLTLDGRGVARNEEDAAELMRRACRGAVQSACTWVRQNDR